MSIPVTVPPRWSPAPLAPLAPEHPGQSLVHANRVNADQAESARCRAGTSRLTATQPRLQPSTPVTRIRLH